MDEYGIGLSTIYDIKAQSKKLRDFVKDTDTPKAAEKCYTLQFKRVDTLDTVLCEWFCLKRSLRVSITGSILQEKGRDLASKMLAETCQFSDGWLHRFKNRHGIRKLDIAGESKSSDLPSTDEFIDR